MKKAMPIIAGILILLACFLPLLLVVGFGYVELGGNCVWRGPYSDPAGACVDSSTNSDTGVDENETLYQNSSYSFVYPTVWIIDDSENVLRLHTDSEEDETLGILNQQFSDDLVINEEYCTNYVANFTSQLEGVGYSDLEAYDSGFITLNTYPACLITYSGTYDDSPIYQKQYLFDDPATSADTFYLTVTVNEAQNITVFDEVINSFKIL